MGWYSYDYYKPYVSVAQRKKNAQKELAKLAKAGQTITPVKIEGMKIARTFWGKAWCDHLESFGDYSNRLPRGRTYVRNGSVVDLQIQAGRVTAKVAGSELYTVMLEIQPLKAESWSEVRRECGGKIGSLVELLQGKLAAGVMEIVTRRKGGLFPTPGEIKMKCSCPDWAGVCKHVAATFYGVAARLDREPELLFTLREVNHLDLITQGDAIADLTGAATTDQQTLDTASLEDVFGIELEGAAPAAQAKADAAQAKVDAPAVVGEAAKPAAPTSGKRQPEATGRVKRATAAKTARAKSGSPPTAPARPVAAGKAVAAKKPSRKAVAAGGRGAVQEIPPAAKPNHRAARSVSAAAKPAVAKSDRTATPAAKRGANQRVSGAATKPAGSRAGKQKRPSRAKKVAAKA